MRTIAAETMLKSRPMALEWLAGDAAKVISLPYLRNRMQIRPMSLPYGDLGWELPQHSV
jgi:hypothetical protein